jgi:hypothetical protein
VSIDNVTPEIAAMFRALDRRIKELERRLTQPGSTGDGIWQRAEIGGATLLQVIAPGATVAIDGGANLILFSASSVAVFGNAQTVIGVSGFPLNLAGTNLSLLGLPGAPGASGTLWDNGGVVTVAP